MPLTEGIPSRLCPGCVRFVAAILKHVRPSNGFAQIGLPYLKKTKAKLTKRSRTT